MITRSKAGDSDKQQQQPGTSDYCRRVPLMQSTTGTTDTRTTSLAHQRYLHTYTIYIVPKL